MGRLIAYRIIFVIFLEHETDGSRYWVYLRIFVPGGSGEAQLKRVRDHKWRRLGKSVSLKIAEPCR